jgi:phage gpG-like protein
MASTWSDLKFELIGTGDQSGTWGATTNDNLGIAIQQAIGGRADVTMSSTTITLTLTDTTALQNARALYLNLTGTPGGAATLNVPAVQKAYIVYNNTTGGFAVTVKVSGQTGVSVPNGKTMVLYDNGTDVVDAITHLSSLTLGSALPIGSGGTGAALTDPNADRILFWDDSATSVAFLEAGSGLSISGTTLSATASFATPLTVVGNATAGAEIRLPEDTDNGSNYVALKAPDTLASNLTFTLPSTDGTNGQVITTNGSGTLSFTTAASGNVTTSGNNAFVGANTFYNATGQTFAQASTNDGIILQGRAGGSSSYRVTFTTATLSANRTLTFPDATDTAAVLGTAQTFTALQTFSGSTSVAATKLANAKEVATISATAATGTINYDITTQSVLYYTSNASANWTVNFRGSSGTSLNTLMSTGESMTVAFLVTQGSTAYYNSAVQVDGSSVTPKYQGGTAWSAGNASSIDAYVYTIVKTGSAAFTVFASQTRFA